MKKIYSVICVLLGLCLQIGSNSQRASHTRCDGNTRKALSIIGIYGQCQ